MKKQETMLEEFSGPALEIVAQVWDNLSPKQREELEKVVGQIPISLPSLKEVLGLVLDQYKPVFGAKRDIAIVGPANVGKSTLYNQLVDREEDKAEVSPIPGTTRQNQVADTGLFTVVDTPGADAVGEVGERERHIAFQAAAAADFLVIVFEATQGIRRHEKDLFDRLLLMEKPFIVVLNKVDLVPADDREAVLEAAARNLGVSATQIIETVAPEGVNVGRVVLAIAKSEPRLLAAIANAMPQYRAKLAWQRIVPAAGSAGVIGLAPLPIMDLLPLLGIQAGLVLSLARVYGYKITLGRAKELVATFGMGFGARLIFQQLLKLGGVPGWVLSAAVAAATTVAIGYTAMLWFAYGERPTQERLREIIANVTGHLSEQLKGLGERRPDKVTLREHIVEGLQNLPSPFEWLQAMRPRSSNKTPTEGESVPPSDPHSEGEGTAESR